MEQSGADDGPITVEFQNGLATSEYDLVVGCDGATSRTRAMGFGCGVRDHIVPTNCWAAYFSIEKDFLQGNRIGHGYSAVGGRFISVGVRSIRLQSSHVDGHSSPIKSRPNAAISPGLDPGRRCAQKIREPALPRRRMEERYPNAGDVGFRRLLRQ